MLEPRQRTVNLIVRTHRSILATPCILTARLASNDILEPIPEQDSELNA
jgi:hypothetical protein